MGPRRRMRPSATTTALLFIWSGAASAAYLADEPAKAPSRDNERPSDRRLTRTGPTEITLTWKHPASSDPIDSYRIQITFVHQSEDRAFLHEHTFQTSVPNDATMFVINENAAFDDETRLEGYSSVVESFAVAWKTSGVHAIHCSINAVKQAGADEAATVSPSDWMIFEPSFIALNDLPQSEL